LESAAKVNAKKVVIVSVVGAFRTGKSFLLDLFLRFLQWSENTGLQLPADPPRANSVPEWLTAGGSHLQEGNAEAKEEDQKPGFLWRGGQDRTTTGIWMYDKPFVRTLPGTGEKVAVVLMDTQGMFDFQTSKDLTAAIFGLSTLISSYQVYNLPKQIQEDKLEQLQYFTEFAQMALGQFHDTEAMEGQQQPSEAPCDADQKDEKKTLHPFQTLDFLVRDWQNFDDEENLERCLESMDAHLQTALNSAVDDEGTRKQIRMAFARLTCFLLPHPGKHMTKKTYNGDLNVLDPGFVLLVDAYVRQVPRPPASAHMTSLAAHAYGVVAAVFRSTRHQKALQPRAGARCAPPPPLPPPPCCCGRGRAGVHAG
jgi:atlastin